MADLTPAQRASYWRYNVTLTLSLLLVWFVVTYVLGGVLAGDLNPITFLGFPLGYYIAAQGALLVYVLEIVLYAKLMNAKDAEYGLREDGG